MSVFSRLLKLYKTNSSKTPFEDFTTEILADILANDQGRCDTFVNEVLKIEGTNFSVSTQEHYVSSGPRHPDCRIDLVFKSDDVLCFMENKVESREGFIQLTRYEKVLNDNASVYKTYLRYCTKYFDCKNIDSHNFYQFRWAEVYRFLKRWNSSDLIHSYLKFLEENDMSDNMDFNLNDLIALQNATQVVNRMDRYFQKIKPYFYKIFQNVTLKDNSLSMFKQLKFHSRYVSYVESTFGGGWSELGFGFDFTNGNPEVKVWIWCAPDNNKKANFKEAIGSIDYLVSNGEDWIGLYKPVSDFLSAEYMEIGIEKWFVEAFSQFKKFILDTPQLEWNIK